METLADSKGKNSRKNRISTNIDEHEEILTMKESQPTGSKNMEWTDEKHSLYLKSMEASFVDHLYGSLDVVGWHSQNNGLSRPKSSRQKPGNPSGQYKVFQDGCWTKINFKKDESQLNKTNESAAVFASPWIKHYKSAGRHQMRVNSDLQGNTTLMKQNQSPPSDFGLCHDDYVTEVMDQNFIDEDLEGGQSSSREHITKRTKIPLDAGTSSDQVVPFCTSSMTDDLKDLLESTE
ncbi:putative coenzyme Q-binding protein COQ10 -like protein, mitochondrial-like [Capsicum annuum]|nr:putative coenzyme Q-binding protein COQ10 -like protein, mitochondrial-like [Capsicum annuum]KAF3621264.1 putative coenzyme Q-binding protein COQ10 -like protein, mitochondrial-like [Capsicum annuum]